MNKKISFAAILLILVAIVHSFTLFYYQHHESHVKKSKSRVEKKSHDNIISFQAKLAFQRDSYMRLIHRQLNTTLIHQLQSMNRTTMSRKKVSNIVFHSFDIFNWLRKLENQSNITLITNDTRFEANQELIKETSIIFVGGFGRSGTTLMRSLLDVHPDIYCGPENKLLPPLLSFLRREIVNKRNSNWPSDTVTTAAATLIYHFLLNRRQQVHHLRICTKDPDVLLYMKDLKAMFPMAKFVYMVRDGRAASLSYMRIFGNKYNDKAFARMIRSWNQYNSHVYEYCRVVSAVSCLIVKYEDLVQEANKTMRQVATEFLKVGWTDAFLRHHELVGNEIQVSETEWSSNQIRKPIHQSSLHAWKKTQIKNYDVRWLNLLAPMLPKLGYDPYANNTTNYTNRTTT